jgi:hypothetical protein
VAFGWRSLFALTCFAMCPGILSVSFADQSPQPSAVGAASTVNHAMASKAAIHAAETMLTDQRVLAMLSEQRAGVVELMTKTYGVSETNAFHAWDAFFVPALRQHNFDMVIDYAIALQGEFSETELATLTELFKMPVMKKFAASEEVIDKRFNFLAAFTFKNIVIDVFSKHGVELQRLGLPKYGVPN